MQRKRYNIYTSVVWLFFIIISFVNIASAQERPNVDARYQKFFVHYVDKRSILEKSLNLIKFTNSDIGRSFALLAGVSYYPNLKQNKDFKPAKEDLRKLKNYLKDCEFFDEIVMLENEDMNYQNLQFFLQNYFPDRLRHFPKSRFLFAYSGHGFNDGKDSYLLECTAKSFNDKEKSIKTRVLKDLINEVVKCADDNVLCNWVLVLLNACYSGDFLKIPFDAKDLLPKHSGAHAITAGGTRERTWHVSSIGTGSIFFEMLLRGLNGRADIYPKDGVITVHELSLYLSQELKKITNQKQNTQTGDISENGSMGEFFFLNRQHQIAEGLLPKLSEWNYLDLDEPAGPIIWKDDAPMELISAGEFLMGSNDGDDDEKPVHKVYLDTFYMDQYEVTNAQYKKFMDETGHAAPKYWHDSRFNDPKQPVVGVSWEDAKTYCEWAGEQLPTEAEWEKAARGGLIEMKYPWGTDNLQDKANFDNLMGTPVSVGSFVPNDYNLYDMAGNVWEWCADWYDKEYYNQSPYSNPDGPKSGTTRVIRGGSAGTTAELLRCANRHFMDPSSSDEYIGFRCVLEIR